MSTTDAATTRDRVADGTEPGERCPPRRVAPTAWAALDLDRHRDLVVGGLRGGPGDRATPAFGSIVGLGPGRRHRGLVIRPLLNRLAPGDRLGRHLLPGGLRPGRRPTGSPSRSRGTSPTTRSGRCSALRGSPPLVGHRRWASWTPSTRRRSSWPHVVRTSLRRRGAVEVTDEPGLVIIQMDGVPLPAAALRRDERQRADDQPLGAGGHAHRLGLDHATCRRPRRSARPGSCTATPRTCRPSAGTRRSPAKLIVANHPPDAALIEGRISDGHGLLADGGVSVSNLFSGDAPVSMLTMSGLGKDRKHGIGSSQATTSRSSRRRTASRGRCSARSARCSRSGSRVAGRSAETCSRGSTGTGRTSRCAASPT